MSVVGIDLGTQFSKVAVAFRKKISMVPNDQSKFETSTLVAYTEKQREIGEPAETTFNRHCKNTVCQVKRFLGRHADDPTLSDELRKWNYCKVTKSNDGKMLFDVTTSEGQIELSPEQVLAAFLRQLKEFTSKHLEGLTVKDCVITCPVYFTDSQRRSIMAAASLAELNVLRLLNETTAIAVSYGLFRKLEESRRVMFVDMGYSNTQVSIVNFEPSSLEMYVTSSNAFLGARDFDYVLFEHFRKQFESLHKGVSLEHDSRARIRLMKGVERVKKILTGNKDAVFMLECLANDIDFTLRITRDEFDALCAPLLSQLSECVGNAVTEMRMRDAKKWGEIKTNANSSTLNNDGNVAVDATSGDGNVAAAAAASAAASAASSSENNPKKQSSSPPLIHSVEVTGGASRIRCVQEGLVTILKRHIPECNIDKCCTTLNGDECVARGAALMCAMLSPTFKVRDFQVQDINYWPVLMSYQGSASSSLASVDNGVSNNQTRQIVLQRHAPSPCTAKITFYKKESFDVTFEHPKDEVKVSENESINVEYPIKCNLGIGKFRVEMVELSPNPAKEPQIKLMLSLNKHGLLEMPQAELIEFIKTEVETKPEPMDVDKPTLEKPVQQENGTSTPASEEASDATKTNSVPQGNGASQETKNKQDQEMTDKSNSKGPEKSESKTDSATATAAPAKKKKDKKKVVRNLVVTGSFDSQISNQKIREWMDLEVKLANVDRIVKETSDRRNELETYVYDMRSKVDGAHKDFMTEQSREEFLALLDDVEQWLYQEGEHANKTAYFDKMAELTKIGDPMLSRFWEAEHRPQRFESLKKLVINYQQFADSTDEKYAHIEAEDRDIVRKAASEVDNWLLTSMIQQDKLKPYDQPALLCSEIDSKFRELLNKCQPIATKPKPEPKPEPKTEQKAEEKKNDSGNNDAQPEKQNGKKSDDNKENNQQIPSTTNHAENNSKSERPAESN